MIVVGLVVSILPLLTVMKTEEQGCLRPFRGIKWAYCGAAISKDRGKVRTNEGCGKKKIYIFISEILYLSCLLNI